MYNLHLDPSPLPANYLIRFDLVVEYNIHIEIQTKLKNFVFRVYIIRTLGHNLHLAQKEILFFKTKLNDT